MTKVVACALASRELRVHRRASSRLAMERILPHKVQTGAAWAARQAVKFIRQASATLAGDDAPVVDASAQYVGVRSGWRVFGSAMTVSRADDDDSANAQLRKTRRGLLFSGSTTTTATTTATGRQQRVTAAAAARRDACRRLLTRAARCGAPMMLDEAASRELAVVSSACRLVARLSQ